MPSDHTLDPAPQPLPEEMWGILRPDGGAISIALTADGHDFAAALREPKVLATIKSKVSESSFAVWVQVAGALLKEIALNQVGLSGG